MQQDVLADKGLDRGERLKALLSLLFGEAQGRRLERQLGDRFAAGDEFTDLLAQVFSDKTPPAHPPSSVSADDWTALVLTDTGGLDEEEAAALLGTTPATVRKRCVSARAAIDAVPSPHAIILEDNSLCRSVLDKECVETGFELAASTAWPEIAVAAARLFKPSLAVVDIDLNGVELAGDLAAMQIREASPECHVLFVTGYAKADKIAALMDNASAVVKPFRSAEITSAIRRVR